MNNGDLDYIFDNVNKKQISFEEIEESEYNITKQNFDFNKIYNFCKEHRVEIIFERDLQFHCFIDYKDGDGSYDAGLYAFNSLVNGISTYLRHKNE